MRAHFARIAAILLVVTSGVPGCGGEPSAESISHVRQAYGEPAGDFPTHDERVTVVEINRVRADPNNVAAFTAQDCSPHRDPVPPVSYDLDLAEAARFFATYIDQSGCPLGHNARCTLRSDLDGAGCDGSEACSCEPGSDCGSCGCGSGPQQRASIFGFPGGSIRENGASGHFVPQFAVWDWTGECASAPHRMTLTAAEVNVVGTGTNPARNTRFADFGSSPGWQTPRIPAASHYHCEWTKTGGFSYSCVPQLLFRANYYDPDGDPQSIHVVLDGTCLAMQVELGETGNRTYKAVPDPAPDDCHQYYFVAVDQAGNPATYPDVGSLTFGTCGDGYVDGQLASTCSSGSAPDGGAGGTGGGDGGGAGTGGSSSGTGGTAVGGSSGAAAAGASAGGAALGEGTNDATLNAEEPSSCACSSPGRPVPSPLPILVVLALVACLFRPTRSARRRRS